eukprot:scaffold881_cov387-Prasinococcus_capsulatus_cf.AAC.2
MRGCWPVPPGLPQREGRSRNTAVPGRARGAPQRAHGTAGGDYRGGGVRAECPGLHLPDGAQPGGLPAAGLPSHAPPED